MWIRPSAITNNRPPWGELGTVSSPAPDMAPSWSSINSHGWPDAATSGMAATLPVYEMHRGNTVELFLLCSHVQAAVTGDVRIQADVGPRQDQEAPGAPNDAASQRNTVTLTIAASAGDKQNDPQYLSLGTFDFGADDVFALVDIQRLGADGADTFAATLYVQGAYFEAV